MFNKNPTDLYQKQIQQALQKCDSLIEKGKHRYLMNINTYITLHYKSSPLSWLMTIHSRCGLIANCLLYDSWGFFVCLCVCFNIFSIMFHIFLILLFFSWYIFSTWHFIENILLRHIISLCCWSKLLRWRHFLLPCLTISQGLPCHVSDRQSQFKNLSLMFRLTWSHVQILN